ncbi:MAG TPA: hypothetical protein PKH19_03020 [Candidatus Syntrophosphaera sp.]|nr:hypothetical protein [Candidatus Syntrophosphaera sp.]
MKVLIFTALSMLAAFPLAAASYTVDNNIRPTGQYSTWISAYNAASNGDTIYIYPSPYDYGPGWNEGGLGKQLTVIGGGFNPDNPSLPSSRINLYVNQASGVGSVFSGLHLYSGVTNTYQAKYVNCRFDSNINLQASNSELQYCWCNGVVYVGIGTANTNGFLIRGCTLTNVFQPASRTDATCANCVFIGNLAHIDTGGNNNLSCYLKNCLFANSGEGSQTLHGGWGGPVDLHFVNCIMEIIAINASYYDFQYCIFEGSSANISGTGNLQNVDLSTVMEDVNGGDYHLVAGSPAIGAGFNGEDIGIYGGATPFNDLWYLTRLPSITEFTCPPVVDEDGNLNVHIEAQSGN